MSTEIKKRVCSCCGEELTKDNYDGQAWYEVNGTIYCDTCLALELLKEHGKHYDEITYTELDTRSYQNEYVTCNTHEEFLEALKNGEFEDGAEDEEPEYFDVWEYKGRLYNFEDDIEYVDLIQYIISDFGYDENELVLSDEEYEGLADE